MPESFLNIRNLSVSYGNRKILQGVNLTLHEGEVLGIIGQNGSGKSTLLKSILQITPDNSGEITFRGVNLMGKLPHEINHLGISYFHQRGLIFPRLRVIDHLRLAHRKPTTITSFEEVFYYFPKLALAKDQLAGNLSGGQRQMLSLAMLVVQDSRLWLMDEPTAGLSPEMVEYTFQFIKTYKKQFNISIILVEHNYSFAIRLSDSIVLAGNNIISKRITYQNELTEDKLIRIVNS